MRANGAAGAETANSPRTTAARARPAPPRMRPAAARRARSRVGRDKCAPQVPQNAPRRERPSRRQRSASSALPAGRSSATPALLDVQQVADQVVDVRAAETGHQVVAGLRDVDGVPAKAHVTEPGQVRALRNPIQQRVDVPSCCPPCASRYWFISTVSAAQIGAAWEVPAPTSSCWSKRFEPQ